MFKKGQVVKCNDRNALYIEPIDDKKHRILVGKQLKKCRWEENTKEFKAINAFDTVTLPTIRRVMPALVENVSFDYTYDETNYRFHKKDL